MNVLCSSTRTMYTNTLTSKVDKIKHQVLYDYSYKLAECFRKNKIIYSHLHYSNNERHNCAYTHVSKFLSKTKDIKLMEKLLANYLKELFLRIFPHTW